MFLGIDVIAWVWSGKCGMRQRAHRLISGARRYQCLDTRLSLVSLYIIPPHCGCGQDPIKVFQPPSIPQSPD